MVYLVFMCSVEGNISKGIWIKLNYKETWVCFVVPVDIISMFRPTCCCSENHVQIEFSTWKPWYNIVTVLVTMCPCHQRVNILINRQMIESGCHKVYRPQIDSQLKCFVVVYIQTIDYVGLVHTLHVNIKRLLSTKDWIQSDIRLMMLVTRPVFRLPLYNLVELYSVLNVWYIA